MFFAKSSHNDRRDCTQTTNLAFLVYRKALLDFDIGGASAGGIYLHLFFANMLQSCCWMIAKNMNSD